MTVTNPNFECDLILRGGITSGVVYPPAIRVLADQFRFRSIGGASAGAIAAGVAAAAEHARRVNPDDTQKGFHLFGTLGDGRTDTLRAELATEGKVAGLFQPYPEMRSLFKLALEIMKDSDRNCLSRLDLAFKVLSSLSQLSKLDQDHGFALCSGRALADWLHNWIQKLSGRPGNQPLTFGDLVGDDPSKSIELRMMVTNLTMARPHCFPLLENENLYVKPSELASLFPPEVVNAIAALPSTVEGYVNLAGENRLRVPILFAVRASLAFPVLLAALPAYAKRGKGPNERFVRCYLSDGGISSNFPIHLFDAPIPTRPTLGITLAPYDESLGPQAQLVSLDPVNAEPGEDWYPTPDKPWVSWLIGGMLNAAMSWRDNQQSNLPGYHDRIVYVYLKDNEGGLNLNMPALIIKELMARGEIAGSKLVEQFATQHDTNWPAHLEMRRGSMIQATRQWVANYTCGVEFNKLKPCEFEEALFASTDKPCPCPNIPYPIKLGVEPIVQG